MRALQHSLAFMLAATLVTGAVAVTDAPLAHAQDAAPSADVKDRAKAAFKEGKKMFAAGDYAGAVEKFKTADTLYPGAAPKFKIAECYDKLGRGEETVAAYRAFVNSNPSEKYAERVTLAGQRIAALEATLPATVTLGISPADAPGLVVTVDGVPVQGTEVKVSPGQHQVVVSAQGYQPVTETVDVKGNEKRQLPITLAPVAAPAPAPPPPPPAEEDGEASNVPAYVTLGIAGAGVVLGAVFGVQALGAKSDFDAEPTVDNADKAERAALIADMSFGVALTFGITGAVLLFSGDDSAEDSAEASAAPVLVPLAGPKGGGMAATWQF